MTSAFVPLYSESKIKTNSSSVLTGFSLILLVIVSVVMIYPDIVIYLFSSVHQLRETANKKTCKDYGTIDIVHILVVHFILNRKHEGKFFYPALTLSYQT